MVTRREDTAYLSCLLHVHFHEFRIITIADRSHPVKA